MFFFLFLYPFFAFSILGTKTTKRLTHTQARIAADLIELRNKSVFAFLMFNALFVLIVFLLQLNKDQLHVVWPLGIKTNITFVEETAEVPAPRPRFFLCFFFNSLSLSLFLSHWFNVFFFFLKTQFSVQYFPVSHKFTKLSPNNTNISIFLSHTWKQFFPALIFHSLLSIFYSWRKNLQISRLVHFFPTLFGQSLFFGILVNFFPPRTTTTTNINLTRSSQCDINFVFFFLRRSLQHERSTIFFTILPGLHLCVCVCVCV